MDDKEKIAMLESDKIRLQKLLNGSEAILEKAYKSMITMSNQNADLINLVTRVNEILERNLKFMNDVPRQFRIALLSWIWIGISLLDLLLSLLEK